MKFRTELVDAKTGKWVTRCDCEACVENECCSCRHRWRGRSEGSNTFCPRCGSLYAKWVNYKSWRKEHDAGHLAETPGLEPAGGKPDSGSNRAPDHTGRMLPWRKR